MRPSPSVAPIRRPRRGMALPVVIVVLLVLSASIAGGFIMARGERAIDDAGKTALEAQNLAETGLQRVVGDRAALGLSGMPAASDSARVTTSDGYYDVITTRLRAASGTTIPALYVVRSHAVVTKSGVAGGPNAEYTVTQLATWQVGNMTVQAALTGVNGTDKDGVSGQISGVDQCPVSSGGSGATIAAVAGPTNAADGGAGYDGSLTPLVGNPQVQSLGSTPPAAAAAVPIQWASIVNGTGMTFDYTSDWQGNGFPTQAWFDANTTVFPTIFVDNGPPNSGHEFVLDYFGRGLLVVYDDIRLNGNTAGWDGIIIVGGRIRSNGSNRVQGATVTGLNTQLGYTPAANDVNDLFGTKQFLYDSCNVRSATTGLGRLRIYPATWANNFKVY
jgi:hypothetical protein